MEISSLLVTLATGFGTLIALGLEVALLVVALGPVQKHRPDASMPLAVSAAMNLLTTILWFPATMILPRILGVQSYVAVLSLSSALLRGISGVLLILGVIRLATPPNGDPTRYV